MRHGGQEPSVFGEPRIVGEQTGRVSEDHKHGGTDEVGNDGGQPVVVAKLDLIHDDGVVLIHDRDDTHCQHPGHRTARIEILAPVSEHIPREEYLTDLDPVVAEQRRIPLHQAGLSDGRSDLEVRDGSRAFGETERRETGRNRARCHEYDGVSTDPQ